MEVAEASLFLAEYEGCRGDNEKQAKLLAKTGLSKWSSVRDKATNARRILEAEEYVVKKPPIESLSLEQHFEFCRQLNSILAPHALIPDTIDIEIKARKPIGLVFTSDWQVGQPGVDYDQLENDIKFIKETPGLYVYIGGDGYQNIIQPSKIGSSHNQVPISGQKAMFYLIQKYLVDKVLAIGTGNHNYWSALADGEDWDAELANRLNLVYTGHAGLLNLKLGTQIYKILRMHKGRFNSSFNPTHSPKQHQRLDYPDARIIVVEHNHIADVEQYRYNGQECLAIRPGTYAVNDDYAKQNGYFGQHIANPTVILWPDKDKIIGFKDMRDGADHLEAVR